MSPKSAAASVPQIVKIPGVSKLDALLLALLEVTAALAVVPEVDELTA